MSAADDRQVLELLRSCSMTFGHIQLFRDEGGWQASVCHYQPQHDGHDGKRFADPVEALQRALVEDERRERDLQRRYAAAPKGGAVAPVSDDDDMFAELGL